ncbi:MAG TPA: hypothetical protein VKA91_01625 [Nitrososphaeraceae archaeon]|nr:hypothetical protein [Nitrososphaeraceae archaeon]
MFIYFHAYAIHQRNVLKDDEWTGWLHWMRNCFKYGTIGEQWKRTQSERWFSDDFENFINEEIMTKPGSRTKDF